MDYLKAVEGLLAFHRAEIERLDVARKVLLEIDRRAGEKIVAKRAKAGQAKKRTVAKKANGAGGTLVDASTAKAKIIDLLAAEPDLKSGTIMVKIDMATSPQAKQRVYTALYDLRRKGQVAVDAQHQYRLAKAA